MSWFICVFGDTVRILSKKEVGARSAEQFGIIEGFLTRADARAERRRMGDDYYIRACDEATAEFLQDRHEADKEGEREDFISCS